MGPDWKPQRPIFSCHGFVLDQAEPPTSVPVSLVNTGTIHRIPVSLVNTGTIHRIPVRLVNTGTIHRDFSGILKTGPGCQ